MTRHRENDSASIPINEKTRITTPVILLIALAGGIISATLAWADLRDIDRKHTGDITNHADRIKRLEDNQAKIDVMQNDIDWIRRNLETRERMYGLRADKPPVTPQTP